MSYAGAQAWQEAGHQLTGIGARVGRKRLEDEELERQAAEDVRRHGREDTAAASARLGEELQLARLGGGFGDRPTETTTIVGTEPMPEFKAPTLFGEPSGGVGIRQDQTSGIGARVGQSGGPGVRLAPPPAAPDLGLPEAGPVTYERPDDRYQSVGGGRAYIKRPEVMAAEQEYDAEQRTLRIENEKLRMRREETTGRIPAIAERIRIANPGLTPEQATAQAGLMAEDDATYGQLNPTAGAEGPTPTSLLTTRRTLATQAASAIGRVVKYAGDTDEAIRAEQDAIAQQHGFDNAAAVAAELRSIGGAGGRVTPPPDPMAAMEAETRGAMRGYDEGSIDALLERRRAAGAPPAAAAAPASPVAQPAAPVDQAATDRAEWDALAAEARARGRSPEKDLGPRP